MTKRRPPEGGQRQAPPHDTGSGEGALLSAHHSEMLRASAIAENVIAARGYWTATRVSELERLGYRRNTVGAPALVIPVLGPDGGLAGYQVRPDVPPVIDGKIAKYLSPPGGGIVLDVPSTCRPLIGSARVPLWVTEGSKKADALASAGVCAVALLGVDCFDCEAWDRVALGERRVYVAYDSDVMRKRTVYGALERLSRFLATRGAELWYVYLPEQLEGIGGKVGVDDYLATGRRIEDLYSLAEPELRPPPAEPEPERREAWPTSSLLFYVERLLRLYVRFPTEHAPSALALYVLHTWALEAARATPYMLIVSPEKQSGKTRVLEVAELVVRKPVRAANITAAGVFQAIEKWTPTLMVDELDAVFRSRTDSAEELRAVLNAGNRRGNYVVRGTREGEPVMFGTFCPKLLAGINTGRLPDTIRDRSIVIEVQRQRADDPAEDLFLDELTDDLDELRGRLEDWAAANAEQLAEWRRRERIHELNDRLQEAWGPLLAIAELAGEGWPERAREAAKSLAIGAADAGDEAHSHILLLAMRAIFGSNRALWSKTICERLNADEELPFGGYGRSAGITPHGVAMLLKPYKIGPRSVREDGQDGTAKGYKREQFDEAWERYARTEAESAPGEGSAHKDPCSQAARASQAAQANNHGGSDPARHAAQVRHSGQALEPVPAAAALVPDGVPDENPDEHWDVPDVPDVAPNSRPTRAHSRGPNSDTGRRPVATASRDASHDPFCAYPERHAGRSWRTHTGRLVCGICHPPTHDDLVAE